MRTPNTLHQLTSLSFKSHMIPSHYLINKAVWKPKHTNLCNVSANFCLAKNTLSCWISLLAPFLSRFTLWSSFCFSRYSLVPCRFLLPSNLRTKYVKKLYQYDWLLIFIGCNNFVYLDMMHLLNPTTRSLFAWILLYSCLKMNFFPHPLENLTCQ